MGKYLNPGNEAFIRNTKKNYIDKTGMIEIVNDTIGSSQNLTCISRPRRFGKSFAAQMLCAYYDCSCDSHDLFDQYEIHKSDSYEEHINRYNVILIDVAGFISTVKQSDEQQKMSGIPGMIIKSIREDMIRMFPELSDIPQFEDCLLKCVEITGHKFVFIIDEWDALIREAKGDGKLHEAYLHLLRGLFKNANLTPYVVAAAYMTGILPIKKDGSQSALSDFWEYSILDPDGYTKYTGFTENETKKICDQYNMDFEEAKRWYDGYSIGDVESVYNPYSLMQAMNRRKYCSYWKYTSAADALETYISMNFDGLHEDVLRLIAGEELEVRTDGFKNDLTSFQNKDDVLTLMIHLGYLTYDAETEFARIPNEEIRTEFVKLLECGQTPHFAELVRASQKLLQDTLAGNSDAVVEAIERVRKSNYAPAYYNNEQALRSVIKFAYVICMDKYMKVEELPSGTGIADVVFIPKRKTPDPAMIVELKWNKSSDAAISQIRNQDYPAALENYGGEIVLVGINYNDKTKEHTCRIERIVKYTS
ncbi:MAG: AAA family ATPase [Lachnospiraceae bacterium]|nr:AAA family ATPase [Lachnospiraceae bacterium]